MVPKSKNSLKKYQWHINRAMDFINQHLDDDPSLDEIAAAAAFSKFHFHRLFKGVVGETVADFTRRLRLEKAAHLLLYDRRQSITQIAFTCGFSSSQNFAKAFRQRFGQSPGAFRRASPEGANWMAADPREPHYSKIGNANPALMAYDARQFDLADEWQLKRLAMNVQIKKIDPFTVAYVRHIGPYTMSGAAAAFEALQQWSRPWGDGQEGLYLGIYWDNPDITPAAKCRYDACVVISEDSRHHEEAAYQRIPGSLYAIYHCEVQAHDFARPWDELFTYWFPTSGYQPGSEPGFEVFYNDGRQNPAGQWILDLCVPVKPL